LPFDDRTLQRGKYYTPLRMPNSPCIYQALRKAPLLHSFRVPFREYTKGLGRKSSNSVGQANFLALGERNL
jgi:hypothetical protein